MLNLYGTDLDAPGVCHSVKYVLKFAVYLVPFGKKVIEGCLTEDASKSSLRKLACSVYVILYFQNGFLRIDDPEVNNRIHSDRYVIMGYDILRRNIHGYDPEINPPDTVYHGPDYYQPRSFETYYLTQSEYNTPLILFENFKRRRQEKEQDHHYYNNSRIHCHSLRLFDSLQVIRYQLQVSLNLLQYPLFSRSFPFPEHWILPLEGTTRVHL